MAHPDLNQLLNYLLPFAKKMLAEHGEFYPFGSLMKTNGEIAPVTTHEKEEHPASQRLIDLLTQALRKHVGTGELQAVGICYDVRTTPPGRTEKCDAVCASLEDRSGEAINVFLPYGKASDGRVQYMQMFATSRTPQFFVLDKAT